MDHAARLFLEGLRARQQINLPRPIRGDSYLCIERDLREWCDEGEYVMPLSNWTRAPEFVRFIVFMQKGLERKPPLSTPRQDGVFEESV